MDQQPQQFLERLVGAFGPTGFEGPVVSTWLDYVRDFADETFTDSYGNGFAVLNPDGDPTVVLTGHADELGLMVTYIDDNGFLWVGPLGGVDAKIMPSMRVRVLTKKGPLAGVIGALPPHLQRAEGGGAELKRYRFGENVYIDIGARDRAAAEKRVRVGDAAIVDYSYFYMRNETVVARGLDNKIGIWSAAEGLRQASLQRAKLKARVVAVATVQEEIGGYGAMMSAFRIDPDVAIAVDVTQSVDHPTADRKRFGDQKLAIGPVLAHGSACHPVVTERIEKVAAKLKITLQHEASPNYTGTDADGIYVTRAGVPTAVVSLPQRYMHSPSEMVSLPVLETIPRLLAGFCLDLKKGERFQVAV